MSNPYVTEYPAYPDLFSGRVKELEVLEKALKNTVMSDPPSPQNIAIVGGWGIGKTSLLNKFSSLAKRDCFGVKITLTPEKCKDFESFIFTTIDEIHKAVWEREDIPARIKENISQWKLDSLDIFGAVIKKGEKIKPPLSSVLKDNLLKLWNKLKTHISTIIIMYDDLHYLVDSYPKALYDVRGIFQDLREAKCRFMLLATGYHDLFTKIRGISEPLMRFFHQIELNPFTLEETLVAISLPLEKYKIKLKFDKKVMDLIHKKTAGHPYFVMFFAHDLLEHKQKGKITVFLFNSIYDKIFSHLAAARFVKDINIASEKELQILKRLAKEDITSLKAIKNISHARVYLTRLVNKDLVIKRMRGEYSLYHPLFAEYLRRQD